jgi:hypothetical protein
MTTQDRRPPPFLFLPQVTRCEVLRCTYLRWGRSLQTIYDEPPEEPVVAARLPWLASAAIILAIAGTGWLVATQLLVAALGDMPARVLS